MNRRIKKNIVLYITMVLVAINITINYSAIVSNSDGAAFVTKAEFETLKKDFDEQIDKYNDSIDNKIDGSIANYIAGIKVAEKATRAKSIKGATSWLMYNTNDYPQYVDGKPYVTGYSFFGNYRNTTPYGNTMAGVNFNGNSTYLTNGGFKKHIVGKPSKNLAKNGNELYVSEWQGFYKDEGEFLTMARFTPTENSSWAAKDETDVRFINVVIFSNSACPAYVEHYLLNGPARNTSTSMEMYCASAQRLTGKLVGDTNVSVYKTINDNRFWDSTMTNRVGITATSPAITYKLAGANFRSWIADVIPSVDVKLACSTKTYNTSTNQYSLYYDSSWPSEDYENFQISYTINSFKTDNDTKEYYLLKMANDPNNLQFNRLWSSVTDVVAQNLNAQYEDSETSTADKDTIKKGLLWDSNNTPHLSMGAGYPFLEVNYDEKVEFDFKIKEAGNYKVYAKYGPFSPNGNPATEANVKFKYKSGGLILTSYELPVTGGKTTKMDFYVNKEGKNHIFLKWCDATGNNGGTMDLSEDPIVTPAEVLTDTEKATYGF